MTQTPDPAVAAAPKDDTKNTVGAGPWDVALYFVQRFPAFAFALAVIAALFYGASYIIQLNISANEELKEVRQQIAQERDEHQKALAAMTAAAEVKLEEARLAQEAARIETANAKIAIAEARATVAQAQAEARATVEDTLMRTAERVQTLVINQLSSVEDLDRIRLANAATMRDQLSKAEERRDTLLKEVADLEERETLAGLNLVWEAALAAAKDNNWYEVGKEFQQFESYVDLKDETTLETLKTKVTTAESATLRAAASLSLMAHNTDALWLEQFLRTLKDSSDLDPDWIRSIRNGSDMPESTWDDVNQALAPTLFQDPAQSEKDVYLLAFLSGSFPYRYSGEGNGIPPDPRKWALISQLLSVVRNDLARFDPQLRLTALEELRWLSLPATHVWASQLQTSDEFTDQYHQQSLKRLLDQDSNYPAFATAPTATVTAFWTSPDLADMRDRYLTEGTHDGYSYQ